MKRAVLFLLLSAIVLSATPITASGSAPLWKRLKAKHPKTEKYLEAVPNAKVRAGGARGYVKASAQDTFAVVTDYDRYDDMISRFEEARIVGRHGNQTDVYLKLPILGGKSHLSTTVRFDEPRRLGENEWVVQGEMIEGDFREFRVTYHIKQVDDEGTMLNLRLLMDPKVPRLLAPKGYVEDEAASASDTAVRRLRDYSQRRARAAKKKSG